MVTIPVPPQSIAFPADSLSLPAVVSIQYSVASCHMCHIPLALETPVKDMVHIELISVAGNHSKKPTQTHTNCAYTPCICPGSGKIQSLREDFAHRRVRFISASSLTPTLILVLRYTAVQEQQDT